MTNISSSFFKSNRKSLIARLPKSAVAIIPAHTTVQRSGDTEYPFRQNSNFYYLTGINSPNMTLVLTHSDEYLIVPNRDALHDLWIGGVSDKELLAVSGISQIIEKRDEATQINKLIQSSNTIFTLQPYRRHLMLPEQNSAIRQNYTRLRRQWPKKQHEPLNNHLAELRIVKQATEIKCIEEAINVTRLGLEKAKKLIKPGVNEKALEACLTQHFDIYASGHAYTPIVAGGKNACTIHYIANNSLLNKDDLVLFDVGAEYQNYAADISRTIPVTKFSSRQLDVYTVVKTALKGALEFLRPGVSIIESEAQVSKIISDGLVDLKLLSRSEVDKDKMSYRKYYPHWPHFLGLDVHDVSSRENYERPLEPGMVLTVEPGIYIPDEGIGVRLEDDVLITKDGVKNLSAGIPK